MPGKQHKKNERYQYVVLPKRPLVEALKFKKEKKEKKYLTGMMKRTRKVLPPCVPIVI